MSISEKLKVLTNSRLCLLLLCASAASANDVLPHYRVDCRFYGKTPHFCYASATYDVEDHNLKNIRYGVGCDYQTIYNDNGVVSPFNALVDEIRPRTSVLPKVRITPGGSLAHAGTYSAQLEISSGRLEDGTCYVDEVHEGDRLYGPFLFD